MSDPHACDQARLDPEAQTLALLNGADFDLAMLHDWSEVEPELWRLITTWQPAPTAPVGERLDLELAGMVGGSTALRSGIFS